MRRIILGSLLTLSLFTLSFGGDSSNKTASDLPPTPVSVIKVAADLPPTPIGKSIINQS